MLDLSPSPPGGLSLFFTFQKERPATNKSGADPGEGPGGWPPLMFRPNCGPKGQKNFSWRRAPPLSKDLDNRTPPPALSQGLDPALQILLLSMFSTPSHLQEA